MPLCPSPGLGLNLGLSGGKPETNRPSSGVVLTSYTKGMSCMSEGSKTGRHNNMMYYSPPSVFGNPPEDIGGCQDQTSLTS